MGSDSKPPNSNTFKYQGDHEALKGTTMCYHYDHNHFLNLFHWCFIPFS